MDKFIVTFARGFGTGGKAIASQLAKDLGIHCYENRILTLASQLSGLPENVFQEDFRDLNIILHEMKNLFPMIDCLNIRVRSFVSWRRRNRV